MNKLHLETCAGGWATVKIIDGFTLDTKVHLKCTWDQVYMKSTWSALSFLA